MLYLYVFLIIAVGLLPFILRKRRGYNAVASESQESQDNQSSNDLRASGDDSRRGRKKKSALVARRTGSRETQGDLDHLDAEHAPWVAATFKGHKTTILDVEWSNNCKFLATCGSDRDIMIWASKDLSHSIRNHRSIRVNIQFDCANKIVWAPDNVSFVIGKLEEGSIEAYRVYKKVQNSFYYVDFASHIAKGAHADKIIGLGIDPQAKSRYIMSASKDGALLFHSLKGQKLCSVEILEGIQCAKITPCGNYVIVARLIDLRLYKLKFSQDELTKCELDSVFPGHESSIKDLSMNSDGSRVVSLTENGIWRIFDRSDPTIVLIAKGTLESDFIPESSLRVAMSPDGSIICVSTLAKHLHFFVVELGKVTEMHLPVWTLNIPPATSMKYSPDGNYLALGLVTSGVIILHDVPGKLTRLNNIRKTLMYNKSTLLENQAYKLYMELNNIGVAADD